MDTGSAITTILTMLLCVGGGGLFCLIIFWVYGFTPIFHWFIKSNSEPAQAVILEVKKAGWAWDSGGRYSQGMVFQPVRVKLEVHPNNGAAYIANDRFNAKAKFYSKLKPGSQIQVSIFRPNPQWVASLQETVAEVQEQNANKQIHKGQTENRKPAGGNAKKQLEELKQMLASGLITQEDYDDKKAEILEDM
jgi:hypothetical protein